MNYLNQWPKESLKRLKEIINEHKQTKPATKQVGSESSKR
jgi:hypothetical protein